MRGTTIGKVLEEVLEVPHSYALSILGKTYGRLLPWHRVLTNLKKIFGARTNRETMSFVAGFLEVAIATPIWIHDSTSSRQTKTQDAPLLGNRSQQGDLQNRVGKS